jgi:hypothetical protein
MISIIVPVHNESLVLRKNILVIKNYVEKNLHENYEIIISEDGSTDDTEKIAKEIASNNKNVFYIHSKKRLGRGGGLKKAGRYVRGDYIIYMDVDLSTNLDSIKKLAKWLEEYDIVIGSRYLRSSTFIRSPLRLFLSKNFNFIRRLMFPSLKVKDAQCGFKGFRKKVFLEINKKVRHDGWSWDTEFLIMANRYGYSIKEISVSWEEGQKSTVNIIKDSIFFFFALFDVWLRNNLLSF